MHYGCLVVLALAVLPCTVPGQVAAFVADERFSAPQLFMWADSKPLIVDFDNDGDLDALVGGIAAPRAEPWLLLNDGSGRMSIVRLPSVLPALAFLPFEFAAEDVDGDGDRDVILATGFFIPAGAQSVHLFRNMGHNRFILDTKAIPSSREPVHRVRLFDVDGDGDLDLFKAKAPINWPKGGKQPGHNELLLNDGKGVFRDVTRTHLPFDKNASVGVGIADFDGDGDLDIFLGNGVSMDTPMSNLPEFNKLYLNDGRGRFSLGTIVGDTKTLTNGVAIGDLDGDGDIDVIAANGFSTIRRAPTVYLNDGKGRLIVKANACPIPTFPFIMPYLVDIDHDGDLDILGGSKVFPLTNLLLEYENTGGGTFRFLGALRIPQDAIPPVWAVGDMDNDGDTDFISPSYDYLKQKGGLRISMNTERQVFRPLASRLRPGGTYTVDLYAGQGHLMLPILGTKIRRTPFGPFGTLWIDPSSMITLPVVRMPASRKVSLSFPIPNNPWLVGKQLAIQALDIDPQGKSPRFTAYISDLIRR